jgi:ABC-type antimicrobial peptide transport system permease subunit
MRMRHSGDSPWLVWGKVPLVRAQTLRERMLATLSLFFATVALVLAGVGPYGVLDYVIVGRRRELGIRIALGAPHADIARRVTLEVFSMLLLGAAAGLTLGLASAALGSIPPFPPHRRSARPRRRRGSRWEIGFAAKGRIRASIRMWWMYQAESTSVFMPS